MAGTLLVTFGVPLFLPSSSHGIHKQHVCLYFHVSSDTGLRLTSDDLVLNLCHIKDALFKYRPFTGAGD